VRTPSWRHLFAPSLGAPRPGDNGRRWACLLLALGCNLSRTASAADMALVEQGQPRATIVIAAKASPKAATAAAELQFYVERLSGARLPVVGDTTFPDGPLVLVGASRLTAALDIPLPSGVTPARRDEGYVIWCRDHRLVLAGNDDGPYHGTEYAVYDFLDRQGVRWYMPGAFGEVVPTRRTIVCPVTEIHEQPDFVLRDWWLHLRPELADDERRWKLRNRMNPDHDGFFRLPGDGSVRQVLTATRVEQQPELFALRADGTRDPNYPNLTHPEAVRMVVDSVEAWFRRNPGETSYGFAPDDGLPRDYNPETLKRNTGLPAVQGRPGVAAEVNVSDEWFGFVNQVAAGVRRQFPGVFLSTNGYANRDIPPLTVRPDSQVVVMFAAIWSCTVHGFGTPTCWQKVRQGQMLQRWGELSPNVWVYGYGYNMLVSGLTLLPEFTKLRQDMPRFKQWGILGFIDETRNVWMESGIASRYLRARLEWEAEADVDQVLNDFFTNWYGPAALAMQAYYQGLDQAAATHPIHGHEDRCLPELYTDSLLTAMGQQLIQAESLAAAEPFRTRLQVERLIYDHLQAYAAMTQAELVGDFPLAAAKAGQMLDVRPRLHGISPYLCWPDEEGYHTGVWYWRITDRQRYYQEMADKVQGRLGQPVAWFPTEAALALDPFDEGRYAGWYLPGFVTTDWQPVTTTRPFFAQGHRTPQGHSWVGNVWYRFRVAVPAEVPGQTVRLCVPQVAAEAWCWVNGQYAGHRPYQEPYERPAAMDVEVTHLIRPGQVNDIAFRVNTSLALSADAEGIWSRPFLYSPR
jgi:hypothetical protein